jgi:phosphatidylglycerol:prolipoprotein diacylglycerol transferase
MLRTPLFTLADWLHTLDPVIVRVFGDFKIRWYGVAYIAGFVLGALLLRRLARRGLSLLPADRVMDAMTALIVGVVAGGRLGYILFYQPSLLLLFEKNFPFWGVLMINRGGMSSHGGMIGVAVAAFVIARGLMSSHERRHGSFLFGHVCDLLALVAPVGLCLGRLANFVNGELLGRVVAPPGSPAPWWAVRYPQELGSAHEPPHTPEQARALDALLRQFGSADSGRETAIERLLGAVHDRSWAGRGELLSTLKPLLSARAPSQLVQALAEGPILLAVLWMIWRSPRRPGVVACWFLITYAALRMGTEFVRLPDAHLATPRFLHLTRGQWLSVLMIAIGVGVLGVISRLGRDRIGGWKGNFFGPPAA